MKEIVFSNRNRSRILFHYFFQPAKILIQNSDPKKVKTNREKKICDTVTLEQKVEDIENRARLLENERRDLLLQCSGRVHHSNVVPPLAGSKVT